MAHPYIQIHGKEWKSYLHHFGVIITRLSFDNNDAKDDAKARKSISTYNNEINDNMDKICQDVANKIAQYCNFYKVLPSDGAYDEFKGIFFTGMSVSEHLVRMGLFELNKFHLRAVLRLMDYRLEEPYKIRRPALTERIKTIIDNNLIHEHLGKYGWYLIYKCLYNSVNEKSKKL